MAFALTARWLAREGEEERVAEALRALAPASRGEPGCLYYQPCRDRENPRAFLVFEVYEDEEAYQAHGRSDHFRRHGLPVLDLLESRQRVFYDTLDD